MIAVGDPCGKRDLGRRVRSTIGQGGRLELRRHLIGELVVDLRDRFREADPLMERAIGAPGVEGKGQAELVDQRRVDVDAAVTSDMELVPIEVGVDIRIGAVLRIGTSRAELCSSEGWSSRPPA